MFRLLITSFFAFLLHLFSFAQSSKYPQDYFSPPMDIPLQLSGTFGELRSNHFHSGVDFRTGGKEGVPIKSSAEGTVSRINVSPYGFGNAIYIRHPNGYTTVYAHLREFNEEITKWVREQQYAQKSFDVDLYPPSGTFDVEKGEVIALSGNTGGSGGPHLHYEIRDTRTEKIINPLLFGFDVKDTRHPELHELLLYEYKGDELISSESFRLMNSGNGEYHLVGSGVLEADNTPAFGIIAYDRLDAANNRNGVYRIRMMMDSVEVYDFQMNTFAFSESRYINSHIDFANKKCCNKSVNKMYLDPGNELSVYQHSEPQELLLNAEDSLFNIRIEVYDVAGNTSILEFQLHHQKNETEESDIPDLPLFKYNQTNFFKNEKVDLVLPEGALYRDIYFEYQESDPCSNCYSPIFSLGVEEIPIHKYFYLKLKPTEPFSGDKNKLAIASFRNGRIQDFEGGRWENGFVVGRTRQLGDFAVVADTVSPLVVPLNFNNNRNVANQSTLKVRIYDDFSGIDHYYPEIDGEWVLMDYDAKADLLTLRKEDFPKTSGKHSFSIRVRDELGNETFKTYDLIF